jgi:DNA-binding transcriptional LysR family regulator
MLDVGRLRFFSEVARARSFTEAALRLSYSQSAVSQQIATLEAELGLILVERGTRPLRLTDAGAALLHHAEIIFGEVATAEAALRAIANLDTGLLRVGGFASACATLLPGAIARFVRDYPNVSVTLADMQPPFAHRALRAGDLDLAVTYQYALAAPAPDDGFQRTALGDDPLVMALPVGHRLARKRSLRLEDLHAETWLSTPAGGPTDRHRQLMEQYCTTAGFQPKIRYEITDIWIAFGLIAAGLAVGLMPRLAFLTPHPAITTRALPDHSPPFRRLYAEHVAQRQIPGVQPMLNVLQRDVPRQLALPASPP